MSNTVTAREMRPRSREVEQARPVVERQEVTDGEIIPLRVGPTGVVAVDALVSRKVMM